MKVLHILEATGGGTARHIIDLCRGQAKNGIDVHLAYSPERIDWIMQEGLPILKDAGVHLVEFNMHRAPHPFDLVVLLKLRGYLSDHGPFDIVHGHSSKGGVYARLLRILGGPKAIYTPHAFVTWATWITPFERIFYGLIERILGLMTTTVIVSSEVEGSEARRLGISSRRIRLIHHGVSLASESSDTREAIRTHLGLTDEMIVVGFVGRFVPQKDPKLLLRAFSKATQELQDARLIMVGDGPLSTELKEMAIELGIEQKVLWPGFLDGRTTMRGFDILALPSAYESFGYVLFEAMAEGLPIVATNVGGTELAIQDGLNGFTVPVGNTDAFSDALTNLLCDREMRNQFGSHSKFIVTRFTTDRMVNETIRAYHTLV